MEAVRLAFNGAQPVPGGVEVRYSSPGITDFGQIDLHTYQLPGSNSIEEPTTVQSAGGGGAGAGVGLLGLVGGAAVLAGRGSGDATAAAAGTDEEEKRVTDR